MNHVSSVHEVIPWPGHANYASFQRRLKIADGKAYVQDMPVQKK